MKRNTLTTAVVAGLTGMAGMVSVSNAVNVSPDGTGQVLLYPYYSARGGNDTLISIVNTTDRGKAVKIRFREAVNSRDVLDFQLYMSAYDVWTGAVTATDEGGAKIVTSDTTCSVPYLFGDFDGEQAFLDFDYNFAGNASNKKLDATIDGGPTGIERTASGYIEVIEMATMIEHASRAEAEEKVANEFTGAVEDAASYVSWATKHVNGVPNNCDALVDAWTSDASPALPLAGAWLSSPETGFSGGPSGGLFGAASIINVADGTMFSYNATAIDNFIAENKHSAPGDERPNLRQDGDITYSNVFFNNGVVGFEDGEEGETSDNNPDIVNSHWTLNALSGEKWGEKNDSYAGLGPMLALNAALTAESISNEFATDASAGAKTEWVVTFPTKRFHVDTALAPLAPFTSAWSKTEASCHEVETEFYDREEGTVSTAAQEPVFSPADPTDTSNPFELCREANVIRFASDDSYPDATEILKEPKRADTPHGYNNAEVPMANGWAKVSMASYSSVAADKTSGGPEDALSDTDGFETPQKNTYDGLPVIGFAVTTYTNGNIGDGVLSNYGGTFAHRTARNISSSG